jgi:large subunit ribosomal protein L19e
MKLDVHKRKAASLLKTSPKKIKFNTTMLTEIKEAITKTDLRGLIRDGTIKKVQDKGVSRGRARKIQAQKRKGLKKGAGKRKGSANARNNTKEVWKAKVRTQREFIKELKDKQLIEGPTYRNLYSKVKGGYFRSKRHIKLYLEEQGLVVKK